MVEVMEGALLTSVNQQSYIAALYTCMNMTVCYQLAGSQKAGKRAIDNEARIKQLMQAQL